MEETLGWGHGHEYGNLAATAGLAEDGDSSGVTAEIGDVVTHPLEGHNNIEHPDSARIRVLLAVSSEIEVPEDSQTMIHTDHDNVAAASQILAIVGGRFETGTHGVAAPVEPDHNWPLPVVQCGSPYVET